jgi:HAD superfamily hydrolase (TIGR01490 family)
VALGIVTPVSNLALFDFDGTITSSDTWTPFMRLAVSRSKMLSGIVRLSPIVLGYRIGVVTASQARQASMRVGFRGEDAAALGRIGFEYSTRVIPGTVRPKAIERIEWHKSSGDRIAVVSASLDVYLGRWCESQGLDCICTTLEAHNGRLTGELVDGDCSGAEKARRIRQRFDLAEYEQIYAYGDSEEDRAMLALAHRKYFRWKEVENVER